MNLLVRSAILLVVLVLAGCESTAFSDRVRNRFAATPPQVQDYEADARATYFAAQLAFKRLDYTLLRSDVGDLTIEAASRINSSAAFRDSRQLLANVEIVAMGPDRCEVSLRLRELVEGEGIGGPNELPLPEHGFYGTYFAVLEQVLREQAAADAPKNP